MWLAWESQASAQSRSWPGHLGPGPGSCRAWDRAWPGLEPLGPAAQLPGPGPGPRKCMLWDMHICMQTGLEQKSTHTHVRREEIKNCGVRGGVAGFLRSDFKMWAENPKHGNSGNSAVWEKKQLQVHVTAIRQIKNEE